MTTKSQQKYLALLRGINVGGKNIIKMADLRKYFEDTGFTDVKTYIQSGNVIFNSSVSNKEKILKKIESGLLQVHGSEIRTVVLTDDNLKNIVENTPKGFGMQKDEYRYDVIFLKEPLSAQLALESIETRTGVDEAYAGVGVIYFRRLISGLTKSKLNKIIQSPIYQNITIRNWNTTSKLYEIINS